MAQRLVYTSIPVNVNSSNCIVIETQEVCVLVLLLVVVLVLESECCSVLSRRSILGQRSLRRGHWFPLIEDEDDDEYEDDHQNLVGCTPFPLASGPYHDSINRGAL